MAGGEARKSSRTPYFRWVLGFSIVALALLAPVVQERPPNIVVVVADDLGWADVGWHAEEMRTPTLDALVAEGVELDAHYVQPQCTPTRVALLTGRYPSRFGDHCTTASNERALPAGTETLASLLRARGYATFLSGKWHLGSKPEWGPNHYGFEHAHGSLAGAVGMYDHRYRLDTPFARTWHRNGEWLEQTGHVTDLCTDEAVQWIEAHKDQPFFVYLPYHAVHTPLVEPQRWVRANAHIEHPDRRLLAAAASHLDAAVGRVVAALDEHDLREQTLIVFTSDNGGLRRHRGNAYPPPDSALEVVSSNRPLRGWKTEVFEGGMRVPAFAHWRGTLQPGVCRQVMHAVDWLPTLAALAGVTETPEALDGQDVWPWLSAADRDPAPRTLYWKWGSRLALRHGDHKILRNRGDGPFALFDLAADPGERDDLAASRPQLLRQLHGLLAGQVDRDAQPMALPAPGGDQHQHDLVVYGATAGGVAAAVAAARRGLRVALVEPGQHVGGLTSGGLGATDIGNKAAIGGIAREFYRRVRAHYADDAAWTWQRREEFRGRGHRPEEDAAWTFEPHVAERILRAMLAETDATLFFDEQLDRDGGVEREGDRLRAFRTRSGTRFTGRAFIDASYEGDLMAAAGVSYTVGREANRTYDETLNGVQTAHARHHQFTHAVDPWIEPGNPDSGLLPGVQADPPGEDGTGDDRVQAYCFRICATDVPENRVPWPKPAGYDAKRYELLLRNFEAGDHRIPWHPVAMPNRKTDSNNNFAVSTDHIGANHAYPEADAATRARIVRDHAAYQQGLLWTLANDPRVPPQVRAHFNTWGLAKDEFVDNGHWPHQLYVREARRMVGEVVMTEHHCRGARRVEDPVGLAAYTMDSHHVQRYVTADGTVRNEGDVQVGGFAPYGISYRAIVPAREECTNLAVPVCLSASHIAFGSIRMEPVFMVLGHSAAVAIALAMPDDIALQDVGYATLRTELLADDQVLDWPATR